MATPIVGRDRESVANYQVSSLTQAGNGLRYAEEITREGMKGKSKINPRSKMAILEHPKPKLPNFLIFDPFFMLFHHFLMKG